MNARSSAGLAMLLLAAALMAVFFLNYDPNAVLQPGDPGPQAADRPAGVLSAAQVDSFLEDFNAVFQSLKSSFLRTGYRAAVEGGSSLRAAASDSLFVLNAYCGSRTVLLSLGPAAACGGLSELQERQILAIRREAMRRPAVLPSVRLETLDAAAAWPESLAAGGDLTASPDLNGLAAARLAAARAIGFSSVNDAVAAGLGLTPEETGEMLQSLRDELSPLYRQFHAALRRDLAKTFQAEIPGFLPVQWLEWNLACPASSLGRRVATRELERLAPRDMAAHAEDLCVSVGMPALAGAFLQSGVAPLPAGSPQTEARAWPVAPPQDMRLTLPWEGGELALYRKAHGETARLHAVSACAEAGLPPLLADDPAGIMTSAVTVAFDLAARSSAYLERRLADGRGDRVPTPAGILLDGAGTEVFGLYLDLAVRAPWLLDLGGSGEPKDDPVGRWWDLLAQAGLGLDGPADATPPEALMAALGDPDAILSRALGIIVGHQLHRYICGSILQQDVRMADYHGNRAAGDFLLAIMRQGRGADWQRILREATGEDPSAQALREYYRDLEMDLHKANAGGSVGWPETATGAVNR